MDWISQGMDQQCSGSRMHLGGSQHLARQCDPSLCCVLCPKESCYDHAASLLPCIASLRLRSQQFVLRLLPCLLHFDVVAVACHFTMVLLLYCGV